MSYVWEHSKQQGGTLLVLLAIADFADDAGVAYPKVPALAAKARLSETSIHRILRDLQTAGELTIVIQGGPNRANLFQVNALGCQNSTLPSKEGAKIAPTPDMDNDGCQNGRVPPATVEGAAGDNSLMSNRQGTVIRTVKEPSTGFVPTPGFEKGFAALKEIPSHLPSGQRDASLMVWLADNQVHADVFFRAATALAGRWPPKGTKNPNVWLQVRTYCLNQKKWDAERVKGTGPPQSSGTRAPSFFEKQQEMERNVPTEQRGRPIRRI
jgi:hypothetical protein